jgi:hypothetical protein
MMCVKNIPVQKVIEALRSNQKERKKNSSAMHYNSYDGLNRWELPGFHLQKNGIWTN